MGRAVSTDKGPLTIIVDDYQAGQELGIKGGKRDIRHILSVTVL